MIKEDNAGDADKLHEVDRLLLQNCTLGQKAGYFYRTNNREQGREKHRKFLNCWGHIVNLFCVRRCRVGSVRGLVDWMYCISGQEEHLLGTQKLPTFILLTCYPGQEHRHPGLRNLFQPTEGLF